MALGPYIRPELTLVLDSIASRDALFGQFVDRVAPLLPGSKPELLRRRLVERERQMSTSTPEAVAYPQAIAAEIDRTLIVAAKVDQGVDFGTEDHPRPRLVFCMFGSSGNPWEHVRLLARLTRICRTESARHRLRSATTATDLYQRLLEEDRSHD